MRLSLLRSLGSFRSSRRSASLYVLLMVALPLYPGLKAQQAALAGKDLPDAPSALSPNVSAVQSRPGMASQEPSSSVASSATLLKPQTATQKFSGTTQDIFSIPALVLTAAGAGTTQAQNLYPEFHQGGAGYGRYLWHGAADQITNGYLTEFVMPVVLHQDARYYPLGYGSFWKRSAYSLSRLVVTRSDQGTKQFNTSMILGSGIASSISSAYYPQREFTLSGVGDRWISNLAGDAVGVLFKEFSPEIGSGLGTVAHLGRHPRANTGDPIASPSQDHP
jgi:hypothetical protein